MHSIRSATSELEIVVVGQAGVGDVVVDADGEVVLGLVAAARLSKTALTMAGVNSLEPRP
jgi:hypothetical protein